MLCSRGLVHKEHSGLLASRPSACLAVFLLQSSAPKTDATTVGLGPGMKKPEADGSAPHQVGTTDAAQVTWWLRPPVALLPDGSAEPCSSKTCPQAAAVGGRVAQ